jgi:hypothetical protein
MLEQLIQRNYDKDKREQSASTLKNRQKNISGRYPGKVIMVLFDEPGRADSR